MRIADAVVPAEWATETLTMAEFGGGRTESAPLTWAQQVMWRAAERHGPNHRFMNLRRTVSVSHRVPDDLTSVTRAIGALVSRHSALRTRIRRIDGQWRQESAAAGHLPVLVVPGADDGTAAATATADRLAGVAFDHAEEWPVRFAVITVDDRVRQVVLVFSHTTVDAHSVEVLLRDLRVLLLRGAISTPVGPQSVQVGLDQVGPDQARSRRSLDYWRREFARLSPEPPPETGLTLTPRAQRGTLVSSAVDRAVRLLATRHRISVSTVLLAATTALAAGRDRLTTAGVFTMSHNRFRADYANAIANIGQLGLCVVDLSDRPTFTELLPRMWQAAIGAYRHSYYDPVALRKQFEADGYDTDTAFIPHYYFNDVRILTGGVDPTSAVPEKALRSAMAESTFQPLDGMGRVAWHRLVHVVDEPGALGLTLSVDTRYIDPATIEPFLRDLEDLLVTAVYRDVPWPWQPTTSALSR